MWWHGQGPVLKNDFPARAVILSSDNAKSMPYGKDFSCRTYLKRKKKKREGVWRVTWLSLMELIARSSTIFFSLSVCILSCFPGNQTVWIILLDCHFMQQFFETLPFFPSNTSWDFTFLAFDYESTLALEIENKIRGSTHNIPEHFMPVFY